jgi:hypothetical protein
MSLSPINAAAVAPRQALPQSPPRSPHAAICASCACHLDLHEPARLPPPPGLTSDAATLAALTRSTGAGRQPPAMPARPPTPPPTRDGATDASADRSATPWWARPRAMTSRMPTPPPEPALAPALAPATFPAAGRRRAHSGPVAVTGMGTISEKDGRDSGGSSSSGGKSGGGGSRGSGVLRQLKARLRGKSSAGLSSSTAPAVSLFPLSGAQSTSAYCSGGRQLPVVTVRASGPRGAASSGAVRRPEDEYVVVEHWAE